MKLQLTIETAKDSEGVEYSAVYGTATLPLKKKQKEGERVSFHITLEEVPGLKDIATGLYEEAVRLHTEEENKKKKHIKGAFKKAEKKVIKSPYVPPTLE